MTDDEAPPLGDREPTSSAATLAAARAWRDVDDERRACLERQQQHPPRDLGDLVNRLHDDGARWLEELGGARGIPAPVGDFLAELERHVSRTTAPNMGGLVMRGALSVGDGIRAGVGAGLGIGLMVGADVMEERLAHVAKERDAIRLAARAVLEFADRATTRDELDGALDRLERTLDAPR